MTDLRDSGEIEQEADLVLLLHRPEDEEEEMNFPQIRIDKNRHGPTALLKMQWDAECMIWLDKEDYGYEVRHYQ